MKAKAIAISLLLVWVFQILFALVYFNLAKQKCYSEFRKSKHKIDNRLIETFIFPEYEAIKWERKNKEFIVNGQFYDVVKMNQTDSCITIQCISDVTETSLKATFLDRFLNKEHHSKYKVKLQVDKYVFEEKATINICIDNKFLFANYFLDSYYSCCLEKNVPPPKKVV